MDLIRSPLRVCPHEQKRSCFGVVDHDLERIS